MHLSTLFTLAAATFLSTAHALPTTCPRATQTTVFLLAGDSTTATQSAKGGGWGDGFLNYTLTHPNTGTNYGHNGATTGSFISGGDWATVIARTKTEVKAGRRVYVTIQFGHNDQKIANYEATYQANLKRMVGDVKAAAGTPIIVSSLARRNYHTDGTMNDALAPWAAMALSVANATSAHSIDLWATSLNYLFEIKEPAARKLDLVDGDHTHLNVNGSIVFGRMVADLIARKYKTEFAGVFTVNKTLTAQIDAGIPTF